MKENSLIREIQLAASRAGCRLFRNSVALAWMGNSRVFSSHAQVTVAPGDVLIRKARRLRAGLCVGSSDLIGFTPVTILEKHLGKTLLLFTAIEGKTSGTRTTKEQAAFLKAAGAGGIATIARSVNDATAAISAAQQGGASSGDIG